MPCYTLANYSVTSAYLLDIIVHYTVYDSMEVKLYHNNYYASALTLSYSPPIPRQMTVLVLAINIHVHKVSHLDTHPSKLSTSYVSESYS